MCVVSLRIRYFGHENLRGWNRQSKLSRFFFYLVVAIIVNYITLIPLSYYLGNCLDDPGFESLQREDIFLFPKTSSPTMGTTQFAAGLYRDYSAGIERPGREFDHYCLVIRFRRSEPKHLFPLNAIMTRIGTATPLLTYSMEQSPS